MLHTGPEFALDNSAVWSELQNVTIDSPVYEWIRKFDAAKDGRGAFKALTEMCEGSYSTNKRILLASRVISLDQNGGGAFYQDEYVYKFEKYVTNLHQCYMTILQYRNETAPETMVQRMMNGIRV